MLGKKKPDTKCCLFVTADPTTIHHPNSNPILLDQEAPTWPEEFGPSVFVILGPLVPEDFLCTLNDLFLQLELSLKHLF